MSYPFYCQYPASKRHTAFQHPCRSLFAAAALVAGPFTFPNPALAALNCTTQPSCASLGYSQDDVENCSKYIKCPFDTTYKACTAINCSSYTKTSCPEGAESCSKCSAGGHSFYKIDACKDGYTAKYGYILRPGIGSGTIVGGGTTVDGGSLVVDQDKWNGSSASVSTRSATTAATQTTATSALGANTSMTATDVKDFTTSDTLVDWNDRVDAGDLVDWGDLVNPGGSQIIKPIGNIITDCVKNTCQDGYVKDENGECVKAYASCEAAGYSSSQIANAYCSAHTIYLTNGTKKTCYSTSCSCNDGYAENDNGQCVKAYESCEHAGYYSTDPADLVNMNCSPERVTIYLTTGQTTSCHTTCSCMDGYIEDDDGKCIAKCQNGYVENEDGECVKAYASCEAAGFYDTSDGMDCQWVFSIYLTNGQQTKCCSVYGCENGYVDVNNGCRKVTTAMQQCNNDFQNCTDDCHYDNICNRYCEGDYGNCFHSACSALCETIYDDDADIEKCANTCAQASYL